MCWTKLRERTAWETVGVSSYTFPTYIRYYIDNIYLKASPISICIPKIFFPHYITFYDSVSRYCNIASRMILDSRLVLPAAADCPSWRCWHGIWRASGWTSAPWSRRCARWSPTVPRWPNCSLKWVLERAPVIKCGRNTAPLQTIHRFIQQSQSCRRFLQGLDLVESTY